MLDFDKEVLIEFKNRLAGLPSMCRLVIYELIPYCNFKTGTICLESLDDLAKKDFFVENAPGRKKELINNDILRNAFRTIKRAKPDQFIFSTANQRIVIELPFLRELYLKYFDRSEEVAREIATDNSISTTQAEQGESGDFDIEIYVEVAEDLAAATSQKEHVKNNNLLNKNKTNNKHTNSEVGSFADRRQPIERDFYPNQETIDLALSMGLEKVKDEGELRKFIHYNQANATRWVDYNPVFINWLEREKTQSTQQMEQKNKQRSLRKNSNECPTYQIHTHRATRNPTVAEAIRRNKEIIKQDPRQPTYDFIDAEYSEFMGVTYEHIQQPVHQQVWY